MVLQGISIPVESVRPLIAIIVKALKFTAADPRQKEFAAAVRKNVNLYFRERGISTKGNIEMIIQSIVILSLYILPFIVILAFPLPGWLALILSVVMGIGMACTGMCVMHDAVHGAYSDKEWVNKLMGSTMYLLGSNVLNWKIQHNYLHHTYTNIHEYDQDIASKGPIRLCQFAPLKKYQRYQHIYAFFLYGLMTLSKLVTDFSQLREFNKTGLTDQQKVKPGPEYAKMVFVKAVYLLAIFGLPLWLTNFTWWQILIGFFVMHWTTGAILSTIFQMAHVVEGAAQYEPDADGVIKSEWLVHELHTTSDFGRSNLFLNFFIGGLNFQIEHHLFPNICHIHYRHIAPIVEQTAHEYGYDYNLKPTFFDALKSHWRRLKALGEEQM